MKRVIRHIIICSLLLVSHVLIFAQGLILNAKERVHLVSDRNLYIAGEQILFSAFIQSENETIGEILSIILYCELISPDGRKLTGDKFSIKNSCASGYLQIPDDLLTGNYYLRSYTKFMRNEGPYGYGYYLIKIINPNRNEVQINPGNNRPSVDIRYIYPEKAEEKTFIISSDKGQYITRDSIIVLIEGNQESQSLSNLSIAVVPEASVASHFMRLEDLEPLTGSELFFPEMKGISLTGTVRDNLKGDVLKGLTVNLSILGEGRDFMATRTDSSGHFYFLMPSYTGSRDLFLCTEKSDFTNPEILVDNDFCSRQVQIPVNDFELSPHEREVAYKMAINTQLASYFNVDSVSHGNSNDYLEDQAFYGTPDEVIYIDEYVELPTLEEYFNGLPTTVKVRRRSGEKYFRISNSQSEFEIFNPLVMIDLVAIDDPQRILSINPVNISRIEIVNSIYIKGDLVYGGILNFISRKADFAGINLPSSGIFINFGFMATQISYSGKKLAPNIPDTRNTLLWEPHLHFSNNASISFSFTAPDTPGIYVIVLSWTNNKGVPERQTATFEVIKGGNF